MPSQYEDLARASLLEITKAESIGSLVAESADADGVLTLRFDSTQPGYPGWQWNVSLAHVDGYDPTVIEAELLPADGALLAPDWVPWSDRLADYKAAQEAAGLEAEAVVADGELGDDDDLDDDDDDEDDDDDDEDDDAAGDVLHSGDVDGVDIDALDDDSDDDDEDDEEDAAAAALADEIDTYGERNTEDELDE